jgi:putative membrane protein
MKGTTILPGAVIQKNDKKARILILSFSAIIFAIITILGRVEWKSELGFDKHIFAKANAIINSTVALLLIGGLLAIKKGNWQTHKKMMLAAMALSVLFLLSYVCHHLLAGDMKFGDTNHDNILSDEERTAIGGVRVLYIILLSTHILLAGLTMPLVLFTAYRASTAEFPKHTKMARYTWPLWLYVAITGVVVYFMISPYYD